MLSGNETNCLDRVSPWKRAHEMTVTSRSCCLALGLLIFLQRCPLRGGSWGSRGRRRWQEEHGQCGFWREQAECESEGVNGPTSFGILRHEPLPCYRSGTEPLPSAGQLSCPAAPQPALDGHMGSPHSPPTKMGGRRKSGGRKEGEKKRSGEVHWQEVEGRHWSNTDTGEQAEQPSHVRAMCPAQLPSLRVRRGCSG